MFELFEVQYVFDDYYTIYYVFNDIIFFFSVLWLTII
jgi:hypothetical protein